MTEPRRRGDDKTYQRIVKGGAPWLNLLTAAVVMPVLLWLASDYKAQFNRMLTAVQTLTTTVATVTNEQVNLKERVDRIEDAVESLQQIVWGRSGEDS